MLPFLAEGQGTVRCAHGILPVPVPAVTAIAAEAGLFLKIGEMHGDFVTPTGAAIAAALCTDRKLPEMFAIVRTGLGAGKRAYERPSIVRAMLLEEPDAGEDTAQEQQILLLETNIDDCTGEVLGYTMERLFEGGALDVWYTPIFMKKDRPAWKLSVLCRESDRETMERTLFAETTTIGIRRVPVERSVLEREETAAQTMWGPVRVKLCRLPDGTRRAYPEYESVRRAALDAGVPFSAVFAEASAAGPIGK